MVNCDDKQYLFIGGLQRSGTTLVGRLISGHPDASGIVGTQTNEDEGQFVQDVYMDDHRMGERPWRRRGKVVRWGFHREAHLIESDAATKVRGRERLDAAWAPYWEKPQARLYVEKSPSNVTRTRFLQELYPDAYFLIVMRHPIAQGLAARKWGGAERRVGLRFSDFVEHWLHVMDTFELDRPHLRNVEIVRYEDLVAAPREALRRIQAYLGLPEVDLDTGGIHEGNGRYSEYWRSFTASSDRFKPLVTRPQSLGGRAADVTERLVASRFGYRTGGALVARYEDRVSRYGYSLKSF